MTGVWEGELVIPRHVSCSFFEMKEQGIFHVIWIIVNYNDIDLFTKNLPNTLFEKHCVKFNGEE